MTSSIRRKYTNLLKKKDGGEGGLEQIDDKEIEIMDKDGNKIMLSIEQIQLLEALAK